MPTTPLIAATFAASTVTCFGPEQDCARLATSAVDAAGARSLSMNGAGADRVGSARHQRYRRLVPVTTINQAGISRDPRGCGPIFPNEASTPKAPKSIDPNNVLRRVILPALNVCGICSKPDSEHDEKTAHKYERNDVLPRWHGWHAFRRGLATNLNRLGVDDSVIQRILRHSNVAVTQACYIKTAGEDAKAAMQKLETALTDTQVTPGRVIQMKTGRA